MRANGQKYSIDPAKIAVLGCSAGGQLAALVGTTQGDQHFEGSGGHAGYSSAVQAVVDIDGILDFTDPAESGKDDDPAHPSAGCAWLGGPFREIPAVWRDASPLTHVTQGAAPIAFINSSIDRFHAGRDVMIRRLTALGVYSEVHTIPDTPHPFWLFHPWFETACDYTLEFLDAILKKEPTSSMPSRAHD
jgi:pectinesterase